MKPQKLIIAGLSASGVDETYDLLVELLNINEPHLATEAPQDIEVIYLDDGQWHLPLSLWKKSKTLAIAVQPYSAVDYRYSSWLGYMDDPSSARKFAQAMKLLQRLNEYALQIRPETIHHPSEELLKEICTYLEISEENIERWKALRSSQRWAA